MSQGIPKRGFTFKWLCVKHFVSGRLRFVCLTIATAIISSSFRQYGDGI